MDLMMMSDEIMISDIRKAMLIMLTMFLYSNI